MMCVERDSRIWLIEVTSIGLVCTLTLLHQDFLYPFVYKLTDNSSVNQMLVPCLKLPSSRVDRWSSFQKCPKYLVTFWLFRDLFLNINCKVIQIHLNMSILSYLFSKHSSPYFRGEYFGRHTSGHPSSHLAGSHCHKEHQTPRLHNPAEKHLCDSKPLRG